jgi:hypothetical protein
MMRLLAKAQAFSTGVGIFDIGVLLFAQTGFELGDGARIDQIQFPVQVIEFRGVMQLPEQVKPVQPGALTGNLQTLEVTFSHLFRQLGGQPLTTRVGMSKPSVGGDHLARIAYYANLIV